MKKSILIVFLLVLTISFFNGCGKKTEEKIVGKWQLAWMTKNENPTYKITWNIKADKKIVQTTSIIDSLGGSTTIIKEGTYSLLEKRVGLDFIAIKDVFVIELNNGNYGIVKLTKDVLSIEQNEKVDGTQVFNHVEFIRLD